MTRAKKLLDKALANPGGLSFAEFETLMGRSGWKLERQRGSHRLWLSPEHYRLPVQNSQGKAKRYQVMQFLTQHQKETAHG